jgi:ABC-type phosphate/phosphonate transport system substrate-binding protein
MCDRSVSADPSGSDERLVSIGMYLDPPPLRDATTALWAHVRDSLRAAGLAGVPEAADEALPLEDAWLHPGLLLAQTCGYPFATRLRGQVRLVATPCYDRPGCSGPISGSFLVVRADDRAASLAELAGRRAAINYRTSNSGHNLLRAATAPFARGRPFFAKVVETGGHGASIAALAAGEADVAAIDCVTWGNVARFAPERVAALRVLGETPKTPGLPLITRGGASDAELALLRAALDRAVADGAMAEPCEILGLSGFAVLTEADYDAVLQLERDAIALGYPVIA